MGKKSKSIAEIRKKVAIMHEMISTAYHESGHTIYALLHYFKVDSASIYEIRKSKRIGGSTSYVLPDMNTDSIEDLELLDKLIKIEIKLMYAGHASEKYHFKSISGSDIFPLILNGASEDVRAAAYLIAKHQLCVPGRKRYCYKQRMIKEALHELQEHWDAVSIVSHALFKRKKLSFDDLQSLLTRKCKNKNFWKEQFKNINRIYPTNKIYKESELKTLLFK